MHTAPSEDCLEVSAEASASGGTGTDPIFTYHYGAYLYYNLGYGWFANIIAGTWNWQYQPIYLYSPLGMRHTIYENDNVESDTAPCSKRSLGTPLSLDRNPDSGIFNAKDNDKHGNYKLVR